MLALTRRRRAAWSVVAALAAGLAVSACERAVEIDVAPGVSLELAQARTAALSDLRYSLSLDIPEARGERIRGVIVARFTLADDRVPVVFDFVGADADVLAVRSDGNDLSYEGREEHVVIPPGAFEEGANAVEIEFLAGDGSLNRQDDFLYTLFVPDRARVAIPVFDQPDLKARFELRLSLPADWRAVSNGATRSHEITGDRATVTFTETAPISSYLFAFAAGRFEVETAERDGRTLRMFHRETDEAKVRRNRDAIFDLHAAALAWLEEYTGIDYPFGEFDFALIPAFQYGGMEHPGSVFYRAASLLLDEAATQAQELGRASLIAHETAHMWFGDLVTMRWFDDVWTKEVFANFMAAKIVNPSFPEVRHDLQFLYRHFPDAYAIDRSGGPNPIRQPLANLQEAGTLYGDIIYDKAPIVMRHLERLLGEEAFRDGMREYLAAFQFDNASWPELIEILDRRTEHDLAQWSAVWVEQPGRPTVRARVATADGLVSSVRVAQEDPEDAGRLWVQSLDLVLGYADGRQRRFPVSLDGPVASVDGVAGIPAPDYVLLNGAGLEYGRFVLDAPTLDYMRRYLSDLDDPLTRGVAWLGVWDAMLEGEIEPLVVLHLLMDAIAREADESNRQRFLSDLVTLYWRYLPADQRDLEAEEVEAQLWDAVRRAVSESRKASAFASYRRVTTTPAGVARLREMWSSGGPVAGLRLSENDLTNLAEELALRDVRNADVVLQRQLSRITNPDRRARFTFVLPALSADPAERDAFFDGLAAPERREREPWVLDGLRFLNHPLRAEHAERYIRPGLDLLEEIQRTGDIFFPRAWLDALLSGHTSVAAAAHVRQFLADRPDLSPRLREKVLQAADPVFRAAGLNPSAQRIADHDEG